MGTGLSTIGIASLLTVERHPGTQAPRHPGSLSQGSRVPRSAYPMMILILIGNALTYLNPLPAPDLPVDWDATKGEDLGAPDLSNLN